MTEVAMPVLAVVPVALLLVGLLIGIMNGDRSTDVRVAVGVVRYEHPDGWVDYAEIIVRNASDAPSIVLARSRPIGRIGAWCASDDRRSAVLHHPHLAGFELLGAARGQDERAWLLPLEPSRTGAVRVRVAVSQTASRTRILSFTRSTRPRRRRGCE